MAGYRQDQETASERAITSRTQVRAQREQLQSVVDTQIIPQLMVAHEEAETNAALLKRTGRSHSNARSAALDRISRSPPAQTVDEAIALLIRDDIDGVRALIERERDLGVDRWTILNEFLPTAARRLGEIWLEDRCSFVDVTVGVGTLQTLLRDFAAEPSQRLYNRDERPRARLLALPGEQHTFGVLIVSEFFRAAGWDVVTGQPVNLEEFEAELAERWFNVIGISISVDSHLTKLAACVERFRTASCNPSLRVLIGGPAVAEISDSEAKSAYGVDRIVREATDAVLAAEEAAGQRIA